MIVCPSCESLNVEGTFYCEECGQVLVGEQAKVVATKALDKVSTNGLQSKNAWGTAYFKSESTIVLHMRDGGEPLIVQPFEEITLGRNDGTSPNPPNLDLTPYGAYEKGVSRMHAALRRGEDTLVLIDLGSVNGTHLNGQRLIPQQPRVLRDGDEIRFGRMICHVYFK